MPTSDTAPILVASDLSARSDRAMARAFAIATRLGAPVEVFTVLDAAMPEDMAQGLTDRARHKLHELAEAIAGDVSWSVEARRGDPCEDIIAELGRINPQLLVLGTHRRRPFLDILRETTMQRIVRRCDCPALLVKDPAAHPYDAVIAATDFSPAAASALKIARRIAGDEATLTTVHALYVPMTGRMGHSSELAAELEAAFRKDAVGFDAEWRDEYGLNDVPETTIVKTSAYSALARTAQPYHHPLIAVGAHGRVGAARSVLGSVATDLLRDPPCDVLVARP